MAMGITKLKKDSNGAMIMDWKGIEDVEGSNLGENVKIIESQQMKPKIKIINIAEDEMKLDSDLVAAITRQNGIEE